MDLKQVQEYVQFLTNKENWQGETISTRLHYLKSEVLEATQEIAAISLAKTEEEKEEHLNNLGLELFDILWNVAEIANRYNIDLNDSAKQKIEINANRDFSKKPKEVQMVTTDNKTTSDSETVKEENQHEEALI